EDGTWIEWAKLTASDGTAGDFFGHSVSLSRDRALVGAAYDGDLGSLSGSAYVFEQQQDGTWIEVAKLTASDGAENHYLGRSVSLVAGTRALVGAPGDGVIDFNGSVYVYERQEDGTWLETTKLTASDGTAKDRFGWSVSLSEDRAVVGAIQDDDLGEASGSAYVFDNLSSLPTAVETSAELPNSYRLSEPYPNPLNPQAQFSLSVSESQHVQIEVFSTLGQRVAVLHDGLLTSRGTHPFTFDAGSLPSGVYLLRVTGETFAATRTMTLLK
ncbi:MAG: T9SS type A sorting domain-containing protein, partial [Bacteroidetes bacterium]|nr:T9SS type A sorting domain-containing protein [Bacteroidota bacterium]